MEEKKTTITTTTTTTRPQQKPQALNCPRCNSSHTKFCYYNNYSLSQPRYFCKTCRRYWTEGGSLRNVPVGGGSRRNKRSSSSSNPTAAASVSKINQQQHQMMMVPPSLITQQNPNNKTIIQNHGGQSQGQGQDLNLGYTTTTNVSLQFGNNNLPYNNPNTTTTTSSSSQFSAMEFLKSSGFADPRVAMMNSIPNNMIMNPPPPAGLNFSLDGFQNNGGYHHQNQHQHQHQNQHLQGTMSTITTTGGTSENARILFPFEDLKQPISTTNNSEMLEATRGQGESSSGGYWGGGLGGGSW